MTCNRLVPLALGFLLLSAHRVHGQPKAPACAEIPDCADRYVEAQRLAKSGAHEQALNGFSELHRQYNDPTALYPIAVMSERLGRAAEAAAAYQRYLDAGVETDPERVAKIQEQLRTMRALANPPPPPPPIRQVPTEQPHPAGTPLYKRWWLWTGVGVVVAGVAVGVGLGLYARQPDLTGVPEVRPF